MPMLGSGLIAVNAQGCQVSGIALRLGAVTACALYTVLTRRLLLDDGSLSWSWDSRCSPSCSSCSHCRRRDRGLVRHVHSDGRSDPGLAAASGVVYYALAYVWYVAALRQVPAPWRSRCCRSSR